MEYVLAVMGILFGVLFADIYGFYISKMMIWRRSALSGKWISEFEHNGGVVVEHVQLYGAFGGVTWGIVQVATKEANNERPYRVKVVHEYRNVYSIVFRPQDRSVPDIGAGTIVFDSANKSAQGVVVGFDSGVNEPVTRNITVCRPSEVPT